MNSKHYEIDEIVDQVKHDPETRRAVRKALLEQAEAKSALKDKDDGADDLWDNVPI